MNNYKVTIYSGALDTAPEVTTHDTFYEATDYIEAQGIEHGYDMADDAEREQYMQYVTFEEL